MKRNRILISLLCFVMILAFLFCKAPIKAEAVAVEVTAIGLAALLILLTVGVVFAPLTVDQINALGTDMTDYMYAAASTTEQIIDVQIGIQYMEEGMLPVRDPGDSAPDDSDPDDPILELVNLPTFCLATVLQWAGDFLVGEKALSVQATDSQGYALPMSGDTLPANTTIGTCMYGWVYADHDVKFYGTYMFSDSAVASRTILVGSVPFYVYNQDGKSTWVHFSSFIDGKEYYIFDSTTTVSVRVGDPNRLKAESFAKGRIDVDYWDHTPSVAEVMAACDAALSNMDSVYPETVIGGIKSEVYAGNIEIDDVVLPDLEYGNIMSEGQTIEDALAQTQEQLASGDMTWNEYIDLVTNGEGIHTNNGSTVAGDGLVTELTLPNLLDGFQTLLKVNVVDPIINALKDLFVPSEDFLTDKVNALRQRFSFADSIIATATSIGAALSAFETEPPIVYINLADAESQYNWGGLAVALDLSWYARYKPTVDLFLSAVMLLFFVWRVFVHLPGIISGASVGFSISPEPGSTSQGLTVVSKDRSISKRK